MARPRVAEHARRAVGTAAALHRDAELELQALEADRAFLGGTMDVVIRDAAADTDDHGRRLSVGVAGVSRRRRSASAGSSRARPWRPARSGSRASRCAP